MITDELEGVLAGLAEAGPVEDVGHLPDPLVSHELAAEQHGAAAVQHRHVAPAVLVQVVPQHRRALLRPGGETETLRNIRDGILFLSDLTATPSLGKAV